MAWGYIAELSEYGTDNIPVLGSLPVTFGTSPACDVWIHPLMSKEDGVTYCWMICTEDRV